MTQPGLLRPGVTCWRVARARRLSFLVDGEAYYSAAHAALLKARRSVLLLGWDFDPRVPLQPREMGSDGYPMHRLLRELVAERPELEIRILIWDMSRIIALSREVPPQRAAPWLSGPRLEFRLDATHPRGASQHQKLLVVDDAVAFCGGADFAHNRWDTTEHRDVEERRRSPGGKPYKPRHDVMLAVDDGAAAALGDLARERWYRATGARVAPPPAASGKYWPATIVPDMTNVEIGIARTEPAWNGHAGVREVESLHLASIAAAARWIFMENQYFASEIIADAIAARLSEPSGPEVLLISAFRSPGFSDHLAMDSARHVILRRLRQADRFGRFRAYAPVTVRGMPIIVHSKVTIIDDRLVRIGSANINNRSMGFDTECDLALDLDRDAQDGKPAVDFLCRLLAEHMGASSEAVADAMQKQDSLHGAVMTVNPATGRRLVALDPGRPTLMEHLIGRCHLLDPTASSDNWRPWRRRSAARAIAPCRSPALAGARRE